MRIDTNKTRIDVGESPRERLLRDRLEKAEQEIESLKRRLPAEAPKTETKA